MAVPDLHTTWLSHWQKALDLWSPFLRLRPPIFCETENERRKEGLTGSFAMIRLNDHVVVLSVSQAQEMGVGEFPLEIMAHEIGHHIYTPGDLNDYGRLAARIFRGLAGQAQFTAPIANLYEDLLINDRLFREKHLPMDRVFLALERASSSKLWNFYLRIYEVLWSLSSGSLCEKAILTAAMEGDAQIASRLIRRFSDEWLDGGGRFAALCLPYLMEEPDFAALEQAGWADTVEAGSGANLPQGLALEDLGEERAYQHPAFDPELSGIEAETTEPKPALTPSTGSGQYREPFEYGQILKALGSTLSERDLACHYYRERSLPSLVPFPKRRQPRSAEPLPEGLDAWDLGSPLDRINWVETAARSPVVIPGYTALEQVWSEQPGQEPKLEPLDLDLYVDCSGSMPDPTREVSYLTLAGTIMALSALRVGGRVQATLWSGPKEFLTTNGFVRDERAVLEILTGYFGGGTAFPIHILRDTYASRKPGDRKVHIMVISDEGVDTLYQNDEKGQPGGIAAQRALERAGGGGTFLLNLYSDWKSIPLLVQAQQSGWDIQRVRDWKDLVAFAQAFSRKKFVEPL